MTSLRSLLTSPTTTATVIRPTAPASVADVVTVGRTAGWRDVVVDTTDLADKRAVLGVFKAAFGFGDWFGHNLDALADALSDVDDDPGTLVIWTGDEAFAKADPRQHAAVLVVLAERTRRAGYGRLLTVVGATGSPAGQA